MIPKTGWAPWTLPVFVALTAVFALFLATGQGRATQAPTIRLDMDPTGAITGTTPTTYDDTTNTMTVGTIDNCLDSAFTTTHTHPTHLVIQDVEDLVGWQARLNYIGDQMRPSVINFTPFDDSVLLQQVSFLNLPVDADTLSHRSLNTTSTIPAAPVDGTNTPQTALIGATYNGVQTFPVSPDTPAKVPADDASYNAPGGGVLARLTLEVIGDETGQESLAMDLDDDDPNAPGSSAVIFTGTTTMDINLQGFELFDGFHGEGVPCVPLAQETPPATATPTGTPTATATPTATPGAETATPTATAPPAFTPAALPPTGAADAGGSGGWVLLFLLGAAIAVPGAVFGVSRFGGDHPTSNRSG